jgi:hypothetical protein
MEVDRTVVHDTCRMVIFAFDQQRILTAVNLGSLGRSCAQTAFRTTLMTQISPSKCSNNRRFLIACSSFLGCLHVWFLGLYFDRATEVFMPRNHPQRPWLADQSDCSSFLALAICKVLPDPGDVQVR